jgi:hypothetical protein
MATTTLQRALLVGLTAAGLFSSSAFLAHSPTYAASATAMRRVAYSSVPAVAKHRVVFRSPTVDGRFPLPSSRLVSRVPLTSRARAVSSRHLVSRPATVFAAATISSRHLAKSDPGVFKAPTALSRALVSSLRQESGSHKLSNRRLAGAHLLAANVLLT